MIYHVELTDRAIRDLRRLYHGINAARSPQANDWFNGLDTAIFSLQEHPARSPITPERDDMRHLLHGSSRYVYRVIYRIDEREQRAIHAAYPPWLAQAPAGHLYK